MKLIEADFVDLGDFFRARNTSSFFPADPQNRSHQSLADLRFAELMQPLSEAVNPRSVPQ